MRMSNLGLYQTMTTTAKKVGGPIPFVLLIGAAGAVFYKSSELIIKGCVKAFKKRKGNPLKKSKIYTVSAPVTDDNGLNLNIEDQFRILNEFDDGALIEKINDKNNPYCVSFDLLEAVSDFKRS